MSDLILELLKLGGVGLIAGLFASALANRDHRYRTWWEMRVQAYRVAIEALSDLVHCYDHKYRAQIEARDLPEQFEKGLDDTAQAALQQVRKFADSGAFLFSERANAALREFMKRDESDSYFEAIDNAAAKSQECLRALVECSKRDLQLSHGWLRRFFVP